MLRDRSNNVETSEENEMLWLVEFETASPDDGIYIREVLEDSIHLLGTEITTGSFDDDGWMMRFEIDASDPIDALNFAAMRVLATAELAHLPQWPIVAVRVFDVEYASAMYREV
jgi:hypothetical protein